MRMLAARTTTPSPLRLATGSSLEPLVDDAAATLAVTAMVEGLRRSDPAVTRRFFEMYSGRVERTLRRLLGPTDDMEDLVHDVFVDALEAIDKLREPAALPGWVTGIAVITAKRRLQKQYRRRWLSLSPTGVLPEPPSSPADVEARAAFSSIHEILNLLRPDDKIAVLLYRVDGLTVDDASQVMGISSSTFKRRLRRGERHLLKLAKRSTTLRIWLGDEGRLS
jgi:RNA polymerase sigma-70 factor (ECF subfamily)